MANVADEGRQDVIHAVRDVTRGTERYLQQPTKPVLDPQSGTFGETRGCPRFVQGQRGTEPLGFIGTGTKI
jgi:hypothetical protein